jgi:hypothetical protein
MNSSRVGFTFIRGLMAVLRHDHDWRGHDFARRKLIIQHIPKSAKRRPTGR